MAAIMFCIFLAVFGIGLVKYARSADERRRMNAELGAEFRSDPFASILAIITLIFMILFFVGIFVPPLGTIVIEGMELWMIGGIGFAGSTLLLLLSKSGEGRKK